MILWSSLLLLNTAIAETCPSGNNGLPTQVRQLNKQIQQCSEHFDMLAVYRAMLKCKNRIWQTSRTQFGSIPTYFYDHARSSLCKYDGKGECKPMPKLAKSREVKEAVADLSGYATFYSPSEKKEFLILNSNIADMRKRIATENAERFKSENQRISRCSNFITKNTVPMSEASADTSIEGLSGFSAHEHFHLFQRQWPKVSLATQESLAQEKKSKKEIALLKEHLSFHLIRAIDEYANGREDAAKSSLSSAKSAYLTFKEKFPNTFADLDNKDEGTATFVEARATALAKAGCSALDEKVDSESRSNLLKAVSTQTHDMDSPYVLSALATQILFERRSPGWQDQVETTTKSPLELLLSDPSLPSNAAETSSDSEKLVNCLID